MAMAGALAARMSLDRLLRPFRHSSDDPNQSKSRRNSNSDDDLLSSSFDETSVKKPIKEGLLPPIDPHLMMSGFRTDGSSRTSTSVTVNDADGHTVVVVKPELTVSGMDDFLRLVSKARNSSDYDELAHLYSTWFSSASDLNQFFILPETNREKGSSKVNWDLVRSVYANLLTLPQSLQKTTLKSVINSLLCDQRSFDAIMTKPVGHTNLRAQLILLQNPQFRRPSTYVVFAHLLRQLATLCEEDQVKITKWLAEWSKQAFSNSISMIQQFVSIRLYPPRPQDLPPISKCAWWIPCAVRVLALFNATNSSFKWMVSTEEFYNISLDHWDLMNEFYAWESPSGGSSFSFCQYPFILSINAKRHILESHAEQQMIASARDAIIGNLIATMRTPDVDVLFLTITVRRDHLLQDSLQELSDKQGSLRKKLKVEFAGEPGLDMGGLTKEWFQLLIRKIFHPDYGMFVYHKKSEVFWFSSSERNVDNMQEYHLIGILMGLAVYNGVILDIRFPLCCYKKLLSPAVLPRSVDAVRSQYLGVCKMTLKDLQKVMPDTAGGLQQLLDYDGNVEEDFGVNFQISVEEFGCLRTVELKEGGADIPVTSENRKEYVRLYVDWILSKSIMKAFRSFYLGFHSVCASNVLLMLLPEEIEVLVCGNPCFSLDGLEKVAVYDGYSANDKSIRYFWDLVLRLPHRHQKRLLLFVTGSDRIPVGGINDMTFKISKMISSKESMKPSDMLPIARTCFNQLILPDYQDRHILRQKMAIALAHGEGFGLE